MKIPEIERKNEKEFFVFKTISFESGTTNSLNPE